MPPITPDPEWDLDTLVRAKEIEQNPSRMQAAKSKALERQEHFARLAQDIPGRTSFRNNAVKGSKMEPK